MSSIYIILILALAMALFEGCAQYCLKYYHDQNKFYFIFFGVAFYTIICGLLIYSYNFQGVAIMNALFNAMSILLVLFVDMYVFNVKLTRTKIIGIVFVIIAIVLIMQ
jgi:multidrug transporter EmrE-like cation transporter